MEKPAEWKVGGFVGHQIISIYNNQRFLVGIINIELAMDGKVIIELANGARFCVLFKSC